jgi:hypothetical protein
MPALAPFGNSTLYPTFTVELGFASSLAGFGVWNASLWNEGVWGPDVVWTDVTSYVHNWSTSRTRSRETERYDTGTAVVVLNNQDDRFTPSNLSGPYVAAGATQIRPGVPVRIRATWAGSTYPVFYGMADEWSNQLANTGWKSTSTVRVLDVLSLLAAFDGLEQAAVGAGDTAGQRIARICHNAGFEQPQALDDGYNSMQATTLAGRALDEIGLVADSDGGFVWASADGSLVFHDQFAALTKTRSNTSQFTFGLNPASHVLFSDVSTSYDSTLIFNDVAFARAGGEAYNVKDAESISLYKPRTYRRFDLICETDDQLEPLADFFLARFKVPRERVVSVTCPGPRTAAEAAVQWPKILGAELRDRTTVQADTPGGADLNQEVFVDGISHTVSTDAGWSIRFDFASTAGYAGLTQFGRWDSATWDTSVWLP